MSTRIQRQYFVSGIVQGVGYRFFVFDAALRHGILGHARNLPDGRVEVVGEGTEAGLTVFLTDLERGPSSSRVEPVTEAEFGPAESYSDFTIRG